MTVRRSEGGSLGRFSELGPKRIESLQWIGAGSFEERCIASLAEIASQRLPVKRSLLIEYRTTVYPKDTAETKRSENIGRMQLILSSFPGIEMQQRSVDAYSFMDFLRLIQEEVGNRGEHGLIVDMTCLTKIHTLALASYLASIGRRTKWWLAYTIPENYSVFGTRPLDGAGWRDVIIAPLGETAQLLNEGDGRGIIIPGHEADRLIVALAEIEPSGGLIAMAESPDRPDFLEISERRNMALFRRFERTQSEIWRKIRIPLVETGQLRKEVLREVEKVRKREAPMLLFPYGPKPLVFFSAFELVRAYHEASWFVYPIPDSYEAHYSEGFQRTLFFRGEPLK